VVLPADFARKECGIQADSQIQTESQTCTSNKSLCLAPFQQGKKEDQVQFSRFSTCSIYSWHVLEWALCSRSPSPHGFSIALPPNSSLVAGIATEEQVIALEKLVEQQRLLQCENFKWCHT
jgi:hypothetical protein